MMTNSLITSSIWLALLILLPACSSQIPPEIRLKPDNAPDVAEVREQLDSHLSQNIRWGGVILSTDNREDSSWLTVISLPLSAQGRPQQSDHSAGRFIAIVDEYLEPLLYSRDRRITVTGHIVRSETQKVGEFLYEYPVIAVDHYYLWPKKVKPVNVNPPPYWYYDPWFYPDFYPWPYHRYSYPYPYHLNYYQHK